ncbi:MAG: hypothetical protein HY349_00915, partial [Nitrospirae bacterium]|nr:hypothetical protein [Nitrospirota bacterium]
MISNALTTSTATISAGTLVVSANGMTVSGASSLSCGISAALCVSGGTTTLTGDLRLTGAVADLGMTAGSFLVGGNITVPDAVRISGGATLGLGNNVADSDFSATSLNITGAGSRLVVDSLNTAGNVSVTNLTISPATGDPNTEPRIASGSTGCGPSQHFNTTSYSGCTVSGSSSIGSVDGGGGGGGYGGAGGASGVGNAGGAPYGFSNTPIEFGGGGSAGSASGGTGGGAIIIGVSGTLTLDGWIASRGGAGTADGAGTGGGGGSGGALYVVTNVLAGSAASARFQVDGGAGGNGGTYGGGGGGGGRAAVYYNSSSFAGALSCIGGAGGTGTTAGGTAGAAGSCSATAIVAGQRPDGIIEGNGTTVYGSLHSGAGGQFTKLLDSLGKASYSFVTKNNGAVADTFRVLWNRPGIGWTVNVMDNTTGTEYTASFITPSIAAGASRTYTLKVSQPALIPIPDGSYNVIVDNISMLSPGIADSIKAVAVKSFDRPDGIIDGNGSNIYGGIQTGDGGQSSRNMALDASTPDPNDYAMVSYALTVRNATAATDTFALNWTLPTGWTTTIQELTTTCAAGSCSATTTSLGPGGIALYTFMVTPPAGAVTQTIILDISASINPVALDSVKAIAVIPGGTGITVPTSLTVAVPAGTTGERQMNLTWVDGSNNETGFQVERAAAGAGATCSAVSGYGLIATILRDGTQMTSTGAPVYYASTGLTPATYYCHRVRAFNSLEYSVYRYSTTPADTTVPTNTPAGGDVTAPGTVLDLAVSPGSQRHNSIGLTWTAPPDDSTVPGVGQATTYDLRYSTSPIVNSGAGSGQVNFADAAAVSGLSSPKAAGSLDLATVSGLIPNTIYYFALKSTDEAANISAMSNLAGGDNTTNGNASGRTALRSGLNLVSIPMQPSPADPISVFQDDIGGVPPVWNWRSSALGILDGCYDLYPGPSTPPCADIMTIAPGKGYFIQGGGNNPVMDVPLASTSVGVSTLCGIPNSTAVSMGLGWNMIGNPFQNRLTFGTVYVRQNGSSCADYATAVSNGWVGNALYEFNGSGYAWTIYSAAVLEPWKGYWLWVR